MNRTHMDDDIYWKTTGLNVNNIQHIGVNKTQNVIFKNQPQFIRPEMVLKLNS